MKLRKRVLAMIACAAMVVSSMPQIAQAAEATDEYQIYPTPHSVEYKDDSFVIRSNVNVVFEDGIDEVTETKLENVLADKGITMTESAKASDSATNIFVGVKDSGEYVDTYADANVSYEETLFEEIDSYVLDVNDGTITILGKNTDAAFYGIVSLMHILDQLDGKTIRNLTIEDYADTAIRGFIEGYYGIPWSNDDRMSLMEFGGQFKMTSYVFAPKDDVYHTDKWRELYPENELAAIAEMVEVGNANKCRFVWTAHPFMRNGFDSSNTSGEIDTLLAKFDQLYSVGVRQFGVLGDDVGELDRNVIIQVMNAVSKWAKEKGDVYDSVFCPKGYNHSWQGNYSELNAYDAEFPEDVQIFWTGEAVCQPVEIKTLDHFRNYNAANGQRRAPLFWLNWPVNDINMSRLMMGKGSLLHTDVNPDDLVGVVTNPMQDAEASKVALFAVADYAWNVADFDDDQSWADSFAYIDADASEELHTLAKHMSDPSPNGHGLDLAESEELEPLMDAYYAKLEAGTATEEDHDAMIAEFRIIADACDAFHQKSKNEKLKEELLPFTNSLKDRALAAIAFINTQKAIDAGNSSEVWNSYSEATALLTSSGSYYRATLDGEQAALPASKHITPFVNSLNNLLSPTVTSMIDDSKVITTVITNRTDTPEGSLENITDGKESTEVVWKNPDTIAAGTYIGLRYSKAITLEKVVFKMGRNGNAADTFADGYVEYTTDGKTWTKIEGSDFTSDTKNEVTVTLEEPKEVKGVRIVSGTEIVGKWLGCKDIIVNNQQAIEENTITMTPFDNGKTIYQNHSLSNVADGNKSTAVWYGANGAAGDYVGVELDKAIKLGEISLLMDSSDRWANYSLQYSTDGTNYTTYADYTEASLEVDLSAEDIEAKYVRFYNNENSGKWTKIYEISVGEQIIRLDAIFTDKDNIDNLTVEMTDDTASLIAEGDVTIEAGKYLGLTLDRIKDIANISYVAGSQTARSASGLTLETSKNNVIWTEETDDTYEDARYVRLVNNTDAAISFTSLTIESFEIEAISVEATTFRDAATHLNAFDKDRTTEAILQGSQTAGQYITYDLGQEISLESLKMVLHDGTTDYPRHAKVSVSTDGEDWTEVMVIGKQDSANEGEADNTDNISDLFPVHEISYYTLEETDINKDVRYIKFEITRTKEGADKWVRIQEIELNGGNMYMASENNPTIVLSETAAESTGNVPTNMIDGDVSTTFASASNEAGSFTYYLSENTEAGKITILQSPATESGANVYVKAVDMYGNISENRLNHLAGSLNEFNVSMFDHILEIRVEWVENNVPEIHEIIVSTEKQQNADKTELTEYYNSVKDMDTSTWTHESRRAFTNALNVAEMLINNEYTTQNSVDSALVSLQDAVDNKIVKPDKEAFEAAVQAATKDVQDKEYYLARTWTVYENALAEAEAAKTNSEISQAELDAILVTVTEAAAGLIYEVVSIEELEVLTADAKQYAAKDYTEESFAALTKAIADADAMLAADAETRQNPDDVKACIAALNTAVTGLEKKPDAKPTPGAKPTPTPGTKPDEKPELTFEDVHASDFHYEAVLWALENNVTTGYDAKTFGTWDDCTRGQIVTFLWRAAGSPTVKDANCTFTDVAKDAYYYNAVLWAVSEGITTGYNATTFGSEDECTRGQIVTFLWRAKGEKAPNTTKCDFTDINSADYYYKAVLWAVENGITTGQTATTFAPNKVCNRAEAVTFLHRAYK